ncbi:sensor histidine kinase [Paenibacillus durus]|uniref:HAMP domain-containing protein n=1 Tax=Paenibacillus durus ATCC 35681 TaxID=1333534 RepID=A0A0F7CHN8_PAEDU|nr:sensor histidine kinase [Paenibacillus durus]AKG33880.1 hypothetical protein VK70_04180 [Paenibacillus durus ATCC 35681]
MRPWNTLGVRIFIWFLCCTVLLLLVLSAVFYSRMTEQTSMKIGEITSKSLIQTGDYLKLLADSYDGLSKSIVNNPDIQRFAVAEEEEEALNLIRERTINNILGSIFYSRDDVTGIYLITVSGKIYGYSELSFIPDLNYQQKDWYARIRQSAGNMVWFGIQKQSLFDQSMKDDVFSFGRPIYELFSRNPIGIVLIETRPSQIKEAMANLQVGDKGQSFVLSATNESIASSDQARMIPPLTAADEAEMENGKAYVRSSDSGDMLVMAKQNELGWKIVSVIPKSAFNLEQGQTLRFLTLALGILLVMSVALASFLSRSISSPIKRVINEMKRVEIGDLETTIRLRSYEEINYLISSFNRMTGQIRELIERVRVVSVNEKNAQIQALQSQVNPHFLYNTLDMIYWMIDRYEDEKLSNIILSLSRMFQYSSDWENSPNVTLGEELEQVQHYLRIIQARTGFDLYVFIDIPESLYGIRLPKMTLQPLIENAVVHGFDNLDKPGRLTVYTEVKGHTVNVSIADNGVGISAGKLSLIEEAFERIKALEERDANDIQSSAYSSDIQEHPEVGIGLVNVHQRLVMKFGSQFGLRIQSAVNEGTTICVLLPMEPVRKDNDSL